MARNIVTVPANLRHPAVQEFVVIAAVGNMAIQAILIHRRMGPHEGASFLGMALVTEFVDAIPFKLGGTEPSVVLVTPRAFQLPFPDGMVGGPVLLSADILVAGIAEVRFGGLQILPGARMKGVAVVAGNPLILVFGHVPKGQVFLLAMAGETFVGFGLGIGDSLAKDKDAHAPLTALLHVGRTRAMAGFASIFVFRAPGNGFFGMSRHHVGFEAVLVASLADL